MALGKSYKNDFVGHLHSSGFGPPFLIEGSKKAQVGRLKASSYCSIWLVNLSHIRSALAPPTFWLNQLQRNLLIDWRRRCGWRPLILFPFASVPKITGQFLKSKNFIFTRNLKILLSENSLYLPFGALNKASAEAKITTDDEIFIFLSF